jgi:cytochrome c biogenesis protein CcmG, thiol:disulfide interchange protein DsbE
MRASLEQEHHGRRCCRYVLGSAAERQVSLIRRMRAVHVLVRRDRIGDLADRKMRRERLLQHHAVRCGIRMKALQAGANLLRRRALREPIDDDVDADACPRSCEVAHVCVARFVLSDEDDRETGMNPPVAQRTRTGDELRAQVGGKASSVENQGRHAVGVSFVEGGAPTLQSSTTYRYIVWLIALAALAVLVFVFEPFFVSHAGKTAGPAGLVGQPAPIFALRNDRGAPDSLARYRGRLVVMNLWASWCPPCRAEMPDLQRLATLYAGRGVTVVGVNEGESPQRASAFASALRIRFPIWIDSAEQYGRTYAALGLPTTIVVDRRGTVARGFDGALTFDQMRAAVGSLVSNR